MRVLQHVNSKLTASSSSLLILRVSLHILPVGPDAILRPENILLIEIGDACGVLRFVWSNGEELQMNMVQSFYQGRTLIFSVPAVAAMIETI